MTPLRAELDRGILALELNRPERLNALNRELVDMLDRALVRAEDEQVRVVTLTGAGSSFCSGADVDEVLGLTDHREAREFLVRLAGVLRRIYELGKPVVAGIHGHAAGGGAELALEADLRIAGDDAQLWFPDVGVGSTPASLWRLRRIVGDSLAAEMALLGRALGASELQRLGAVSTVVGDDLAGAVAELAARLRDGAGAKPLHHAKQTLRLAAEAGREADLEANVELMLDCYAGDDQRSAVSSFTERDG